jgi:transcriptional regulator with XRE-family HTH domain
MKQTISNFEIVSTKRNPFKRLRQQRGLSLRCVAKMSGVDPATLCRFEQRKMLSVNNLKLIADFYDMSCDELIEWIKTGNTARGMK